MVCRKCHIHKDDSEFRKSERTGKKGKISIDVRKICKKCESLMGSELSKKRKSWLTQKYKDRTKIYRHKRFFFVKAMGFKNHYNAKYLDHNALASFLWVTWKKQKGMCAISGRPLTRENAQIDHIQPRNGNICSNEYENLRWVTREANKLKSNMTVSVFNKLIEDVYLTIKKEKVV